MVFYRKYRPQKIEELDEESVRDTLKAVLLSKKSNFHAFLFTGPKGLGKTSAARIVAKFLNCEKLNAKSYKLDANSEPCNKCYQCTSIINGSNLDVLEIDAASNRGIDEIRALRERINLSTLKAKYKVYIIDEVHMLTAEAFNALLKTLEEPPAHAIFVLCTTDPQKVPATIVSRCLHVPFSLATSEELVRSLKRIVSGEKLNVDKESLLEIARLSDGSFRDGSKILQELSVKLGSKKITKELVEKEYKVSSFDSKVSALISFLEEKDAKKSLELIQKLVDEGVEMKFFIEELIERLHLELLHSVEGKSGQKMDLSDLKRLLELLMEASSQIKYAVLPQLPLELAIVEYCLEHDLRGPVSVFPPESSRSATASSNSLRAVGNPSTSPPLAKSPRVFGRSSVAGQMDKSSAFLKDLILQVDSQNKMIAGVLRGVVLKEMNGKKIVMEARSKFHKDKLSENKIRNLIEKISSEILKKNVTIEVLLNAKG